MSNIGGYESDNEPKPWPKVSSGPADGQEIINVPQPNSNGTWPPPEPPSGKKYLDKDGIYREVEKSDKLFEEIVQGFLSLLSSRYYLRLNPDLEMIQSEVKFKEEGVKKLLKEWCETNDSTT